MIEIFPGTNLVFVELHSSQSYDQTLSRRNITERRIRCVCNVILINALGTQRFSKLLLENIFYSFACQIFSVAGSVSG